MIRAIVVDDEVHARRKMRALLSAHDDIEVVAECETGTAAVHTIVAQKPDVVFLDVQMPGMSGIEVVDAVGAADMPLVVFATAYDRFAIEAFEAHAVDYLLKPIDPARFERTMDYVRDRLRESTADAERRRLQDVITRMDPARRFPRKLAVRSGGTIHVVDVDTIDWIEADGNYVTFHTAGHTYLHRESLRGVEERLDPERFARAHRSHIINLDRVRSLRSDRHGDYTIVMENGDELTLSRTYRGRFLERFAGGE